MPQQVLQGLVIPMVAQTVELHVGGQLSRSSPTPSLSASLATNEDRLMRGFGIVIDTIVGKVTRIAFWQLVPLVLHPYWQGVLTEYMHCLISWL